MRDVVVANFKYNSVSLWKQCGAECRTSVRVQNITCESSTQDLWTRGRMVRPGSHTYGSDYPPVAPSRAWRTQLAPAPTRKASYSPNPHPTSRSADVKLSVCVRPLLRLPVIERLSLVRLEFLQLSLSLCRKACQWRTVPPGYWDATRPNDDTAMRMEAACPPESFAPSGAVMSHRKAH
jgi:hypothetical protein